MKHLAEIVGQRKVNKKSASDNSTIYITDFFFGEFAIAVQALYGKKLAPELNLNETELTTTRLASELANALLVYKFPKINQLDPDTILRLREDLKDFKLGFRDYLSQLTDDLETRIREGNTDIKEASQNIVERKIIPLYHETVRMIKSKEKSMGAKLLEAGGKFFEIDAAPWTPKFYGDVIKIAIGLFNTRVEMEEKLSSNAGHAYQFLAKIDKEL